MVIEGGTDELAHDIAVHIAFTKPAYLSRDEVPEADVAAERATVTEISRNEGKPEAALDKIVEGRMNGLVQGAGAARPGLRAGREADDRRHARLGPHRVPSRRSSSAPERLRIVGEPRRIVLKMSGEALASAASDETIDAATVERMAKEMARAMDGGGLELAVVVGGGNIWRGTTGESGGMDRATSDTMGMLGTVINALALQDALEQQDQPTRVLSALSMAEVAEPYIRRRAIRHLEKGRIVVFAAGMGNPFFTTDTPGGAPGRRDRGRAALQGHPLGGGRGLQRRPQAGPDGHPLRRDLLHGGHQPGPAGDGSHRDHLLQGQQPADPGLRPHDPGQHPSCAQRRADRYAGPLMDDDLAALVKDDTRDKMAKAIDHVRHEMGNVRTGRASSALLEPLDGGLLRHAHAAAPAGRLQRARRHAPGDLALRQGLARGDREGHHGVGPGHQSRPTTGP